MRPLIGPHRLPGPALLAPMSGISDAPFRAACLASGAGLAASEMTTSDLGLWNTRKTLQRLNFTGFDGIRVVQIAGSEPARMAEAARAAVGNGAQIIDINLGCPAKKVCRKLAGSALMQDEELVRNILDAVVGAVDVPVTVKMRTGWSRENRNGLSVARIAEDAGVKALAVHGRTRECMYKGIAEYETIRAIKSVVNIPVFANGDIKTPQQALDVMRITRADGVMIGRAAQGQPWIFEQVSTFLRERILLPTPSIAARRDIILDHLEALYRFYGEYTGVRVAKKHLTWYCRKLGEAEEFRKRFVRSASSVEQMQLTIRFFDRRVGTQEEAAVNLPISGESHLWQSHNERNRLPPNQELPQKSCSRLQETNLCGT